MEKYSQHITQIPTERLDVVQMKFPRPLLDIKKVDHRKIAGKEKNI